MPTPTVTAPNTAAEVAANAANFFVSEVRVLVTDLSIPCIADWTGFPIPANCRCREANATSTWLLSARKIYCSCATVDIIATCEEGRLAHRPHFIAARRLIASSTSASTLSHRSAHCIQYLESVRWANSQGLHLRYRAARMRIYSSGGVRPPAPPEIRAALRRSRVLFPATPPP